MVTNGREPPGSIDSAAAPTSGDLPPTGISPSTSDMTLAGSHDGSEPSRVAQDVGLSPGATIGRYVVLSPLGGGAMGVVYTAHDPELDRTVALKLLRPRVGLDKVEAGHRRLLAEAQALARLNHPNVVTVFDVGEHYGLVFVAMELIEGDTLRAWLGRQPRAWPEILDVMVQAGRGLAAAHAGELIHRDVKPDNVMIGLDGRVRVMDFGLAKAASRRQLGDAAGDGHNSGNTPIGGFVGTPAYAAPEQLSGRRGKATADQFSYCVTLWEALYGRRPFAAETIPALASEILAGNLVEPARGARVPGWLRRIIERGLASEPDRRWPSMDALLEALLRGHTRARWGRGVAVASLIGVAAIGLVAWRHHAAVQRQDACTAAGDAIEAVWNSDRAAAMHAALIATGLGHAEETALRVIPWLDAHAEAWRAARTDACERTDLEESWDATTAERSLACLDERRIEFESLVRALERGDASSVANAVPAAARLGRLEPCIDAFSLSRRPDLPAEERDTVLGLRDEVLRAAALQEIGAYDEGLTLARVLLERAEAVAWPPLVADARLRVGRLLDRNGDYPGAAQLLESAYFEAGRADATEVAAQAARELVRVTADRLAEHANALGWARHLELMLVRTPDPAGLNAAIRAEALAVVHHAMGEHAQAKAEYEEAIAARERVTSSDHPEVLDLRGNLATLLLEMGELEAARDMNTAVLAAREEALGPGHPRVAMSLNNLARDHRAMGENAEARALYERALAIWTASLGPEHPHVAQVLNNLGNLSLSEGHTAAAASLHERALAIRQRALGPDHPDVAQSLANLGNIQLSAHDYAGARARYEAALAIEERVFGPEHPRVATTTGNLGLALMRQGDLATAELLQRRALELRERVLGPDHPNVAQNLENLGSVLRQRGDLDGAERYLERSLEVWDASVGEEHPARAYSLIGLAEVAAARGRTTDAVRLAEEALRLRTASRAPPVELGAARFALARVLDDRRRARALAELARAELVGVDDVEAALVAEWLAAHPE
jgi:tetratricopeptide (TPR) repeat protein